jgi:transcriptional regulator with XRE-family HTH domain
MSLLSEFALTRAQLAALLRVSDATLSRWLRGASEPPPHVVTLVRLVARGELGVLHEDWEGWRLENGALVSPWGARILPTEAGLVPHLWGELLRPMSSQRELFPGRDQSALLRVAQGCSSARRRP